MLRNDYGHLGPHRQRGATFIGIVTIMAILGFGLYAGIRLVPPYLEYMNVVRAMEQVSTEFGGQPTNASSIAVSLGKRWDIEDIKSLTAKEVQISKEGNEFIMDAVYRAEAPFVANISLVVDFEKTVSIPQ
ncbi:MAG: hypothetical protein RLZZ403_268 [Pseudomonadota bacterium]|jgi:hypothetical protein